MVTASRDFEDLFECLNERGVKALIVGAHAVAFHAKPRYTKDVDVLVEPTIDNAERLLDALTDFGFGSLNLSVEDFSREELKKAKAAAGRPQDLADLDWLRQVDEKG